MFHFVVPEQTCPLTISAKFKASTATTVAANTPVNFYLARMSAPTTTIYDFSASVNVDASSTAQLQLVAAQPIPGDWYAIFTNMNNQNVTGNWTVTFGNACSVNGKVTDLTGNINFTQILVNETGFQYYTLTGDQLIFGVAVGSDDDDGEDDSDDDDWSMASVPPPVTVSHWNFPGNNSYLLSSKSNTSTNFIWASSSVNSFVWKVAVWAHANQSYFVWAGVNCPNRCQGDDFSVGGKVTTSNTHGACLKTQGTCVCDDDYEGLTCLKKPFGVVWIVLIAIAVVVIIAIAITAWYIRNRRKRQRETLYLD
jgi:hypothetical protein